MIQPELAESRHRLRRKACAASLLVIATLVTTAQPGFAHTPHDDIANVAVSPSFATDHTVFAISDNRPLRSTDGGNHWVEMVRGLSGQPLSRFAISPGDSRVVYLASRGGGVFRSIDEGDTWKLTTTDLSVAGNVSVLAVSPFSSNVVVAAAGLFGGLLRTVDGGRRWQWVAGIGKVGGLTFVPDHAGRVVIGDSTGALRVSVDDGLNFHQTGQTPDGGAISAATTGTKKAASIVFVGTSKGSVLVSTDAGGSWSKVGSGVPDHEQINSLVVSDAYASDHTLWASTFDSGVYRSTNGGRTWASEFTGLTTDAQAYQYRLPEFQALAVTRDSSGNQLLYLAGYDGLFRSSDGASHWKSIETLSEYVTGLAVSPDYDHDGTVEVNTYVKGVYISRDGGQFFVGSDKGLGVAIGEGNKDRPVWRMHDVVFSPGYASDHTIFTATWVRFVKSTDGGRTWKSIVVSPAPAGMYLRQFVIAVSPRFTADQTIYLGTRQGDVYRSTKGGDAGSWKTVAELDSGVRTLIFSPDFERDRTLFASTAKGIVTSSNAGATWTATGPKGISLLAISPNYASDHTLFAGTEHGLFVTRNRGRTWAALTGAPLSTSSKVAAIALSPNFQNDGTVLVSVAGVGLFRSTDSGRTFTAVGSSLLERELIIGDFENPTSEPIQFSRTFATDRTVYAYAEQSVVRSTDGGNTWKVLDIPPAADFNAPSTLVAKKGSDGSSVVPIAIIAALMVVAAAFAVYRKRASRRRVSVE